MANRIQESLEWLAAEISCDRQEFLRAQHPGGDMLLTACLTGGYVREQGGRYGVSEQGRRRLEQARA